MEGPHPHSGFGKPHGATSRGMWAPLVDNQEENRHGGCSECSELSIQKGWILLHVNYTSVNLTLKRPETHFHCLDFRDRSLSGKESACQCRRCKRRRFNPWVREIPLEEEMAAHSSILAWEIPWTEEPGGLQFMGSRRVGHN